MHNECGLMGPKFGMRQSEIVRAPLEKKNKKKNKSKCTTSGVREVDVWTANKLWQILLRNNCHQKISLSGPASYIGRSATAP